MSKNIKFNIFRPLTAILLLFIPLYPKFPILEVNNTYVSIRLDDIVIAIALFFLLIDQLKNGFNLFQTKLAKLFLIFFISIFLSLANAIFILQTDKANLLILHTLRNVQYMLVAFLSLKAVSSKKDLSSLFTFISLASVFVAIYGFGQKYFAWPIVSTMNEEFSKGYLLTLTAWSRISSTFAGHYDLAAFLSIFLIILTAPLILPCSKLIKVTTTILWIVLFYLLTLTASRVSIFALWGGLIIAFTTTKKYFLIIPSSLIIIYSFFTSTELNQRLVATLNTIVPQTTKTTPTSVPKPTLIPTPTSKTITPTPPQVLVTPKPTVIRHQPPEEYPQVDIDAGVSRSGEIRFNVEWPRAITALTKNPLLGTGSGSLGLATDNNYLRILGENGILGFLSFMLIPLYLLIKSIKSSNKINLIFLSAILSFLANAVFIDVFAASKTAYLFWLLVGVYYQNLTLNDKA